MRRKRLTKNAGFYLYRPQQSWAKVMFLQVCVILFTGGGGCLSACWDTPTPHPEEQTPPQKIFFAFFFLHFFCIPPESRLRHTVNKRPVRILLECILVFFSFLLDFQMVPNAHPGRSCTPDPERNNISK